MKFSKAIKRLIALSVAFGSAIAPAISQSYPTYDPNSATYAQQVPYTQTLGDYVVGSLSPIQGSPSSGSSSNLWVMGGVGLNSSTSDKFSFLSVPPSLAQNAVLSFPDPGTSSANVLLDSGVTSAVTIQHVSVNLASADILAMYATPVQLIAAPGAGKNIIVHKFMLTMTTTSTQYASGGVVAPQIGNTNHGGGTLTTATIAASVVNATAGTTYTTVIPVSYTGTANAGLFISNQTGAFTTGTGTAVCDIWYSIK